MIIPREARKELTREDRWDIRRQWLNWRVSPIRCFLTGHKIVWTGGIVEPMHSWCEKCLRDEQDYMDTTALPIWMNRANAWLFEHSRLYEAFNGWLWEHVKHLPDWMAY